MTITANDRRKPYQGNGVADTFNGPRAFKASDVQVFVGEHPTYSLVSPSLYTVTGVGSQATRIKFNTPPALNADILLLRTVAYDQDTDITNQGAFLPEVHENAFDKRVMQIQQLADGGLQQVFEDGEFVWDAKNSRIVRVGNARNLTDAANLSDVYAVAEQIQTGGGVVGVRPKYWEITGDGEDIDFALTGADVDDPLLYLVVVGGVVLEPYDGFTIVAGNTATDRTLRLPAALPNLVEGFVILNGYARPWTGPQPVTSLAMTVRTFAGTAETLDTAAHHSLVVTTNANPVTETLRTNSGAANDWTSGQFVSFHQKGAGQVTLALAGAGTLLVPTGFNPKTRGQHSIITATCEDPDTNTWALSGDLERQATSQELLVIALPDRTAFIGTNVTTGTGKGHFVMPFGFVLESIANGGIYGTVQVAQAAGVVLTTDVNRNGVSLFTTPLTFDNTEKTTRTAATPAVYASGGNILYAGDEITWDLDQVGTALAKGMTVYLVGRRA